jgi:phage terminase Nu1 subunit (DNA packaging protein)
MPCAQPVRESHSETQQGCSIRTVKNNPERSEVVWGSGQKRKPISFSEKFQISWFFSSKWIYDTNTADDLSMV